MPRAPAAYGRKAKWLRYDPSDLILVVRANYRSVRLARDALRKQCEGEVKGAMMIRTTLTAKERRYGERFRPAPQGAFTKGDGTYRSLRDGAHGPAVNANFRIRKQLRNLGGGELRHVSSDLSAELGPSFGLTADVSTGIGCVCYWCGRLFGIFCRVTLAMTGLHPL